MTERQARTLGWLVPAAGGLLFAVLWLVQRDFWLDDAFITLRYSRNLAGGLGPVFNPGEAVEGYTSFLWMLLAAVPFALFDDAMALGVVKASGLVLGLWILWRCWTFPLPDSSPPGARWLVGLLAVNPVFVANCADGLETPLFTALLLECARAFAAPPSARTGARLGALTAAAIWTRPEALPLLLLWPAAGAILRSRERLASWHGMFALASLPLVLGHVAWRLTYYGTPLPNTFYAKATGSLLPRLEAGAADLAQLAWIGVGVAPVDLWIALGLGVFGSRVVARGADANARTWLFGLGSIVAFRVAFDVWSGSEYMGDFRFLAPALPPLFVLADEGLRRMSGAARPAALVAGAAGLAAALLGNSALGEVRGSYQRGLESAHVALGQWLRATRPPDALLAVGDAGAIPFFSTLPTIDLWGLTDATIAGLPGEYGRRPGTAAYTLERRPDVIVLWTLEPTPAQTWRRDIAPAQPFDHEIARHPKFRRSYRFVREFTFREHTVPGSGYYLAVFERGESARP